MDGHEYDCIVYTICNSLDDDTGAFMLAGMNHILNLKLEN